MKHVQEMGEVRAPLGERRFRIEEFDTTESIAVKGNLLAVECLVEVIRLKSLGGSPAVHQLPPGAVPR